MDNDEFRLRLDQILNDFHPQVVVVPGWGYRGALLALSWCLKNKIPAVVMSESTAWDEKRSPLKEWVKSRIVSLFSAALVGGTPHRAYLEKLGFPPKRIFLGYDAVDNRFFGEEAREIGSRRLEMGGGKDSEVGSQKSEAEKKPYFLASARFIEKKNLPRLIRAYALYRKEAEEKTKLSTLDFAGPAVATHPLRRLSTATNAPWSLILLGNGSLRPDLCRLISDLGLQDSVLMPGFKQYEELPAYYANAGAFIHASTSEQWGLVVNEAMASGLPVLVSNRCGCAADLVQEGVNGWIFDPVDEEQIAELMLKISSDEALRSEMGMKSREIIANWGPDRFASGLSDAVNAAISYPVKSSSLLSKLLLKMLLLR